MKVLNVMQGQVQLAKHHCGAGALQLRVSARCYEKTGLSAVLTL